MSGAADVRRPRASLALRIAGGIALALVLGYVAVCGWVWQRQPHFIFFPTQDVRQTPGDLGLAWQEVSIPAADGRRIAAWWLPAGPDAPALLYLHGNAGNLGRNVNHVARFRRLGFSVLAIDYRGYGNSEGDFPTESSAYEDADSAWRHLTGVLAVPPRRAVIFGHSLGAAIAAETALRHPDAAALIMESGFSSMLDMALGQARFRLLPVRALLHQRFDSIAKVPRLPMPKLFVHGRADAEIPPSMSERLHAAATGDKALLLVDGAGHDDVARRGGERYLEAVRALAARALH